MLLRNMVGLAIVAGGAYGFPEDIFWVVTHDFPLVATRLDPVMNPGEISHHVHAVVGGSNFGPTYDYDNLRSSSANVMNDHSNYWAPQLYHKNGNDSYSVGELDFAHTYYLMRRYEKEPVYEFPAGFRMLAGDPDRRTLDVSDPAQDAVGYTCLGGTGHELDRQHEIPKRHCSGGVRAELHFPSCWDGIHSWLEGSKHVVYGEGKYDGSGKCPPSHPKRIMSLLYEFAFKDTPVYTEGGRVLSNGDSVGYSFHADFTNGWPGGFFKTIFDQGRQCSVQFDLSSCPPLVKEYAEVTGAPVCPYNGVKILEDIGDQSPIAKLPGNNPHVDGYQEAAKFNTGSPTKAAVATVLATDIRSYRVKGDPLYSFIPDDAPQTDVANPGSTQATSAIASDYPAPTAPVAATSAQPVTSQAAPVAPAVPASMNPGGAGVLVGESVTSDPAYPALTVPAGVSDLASSAISINSPAVKVAVPSDGPAVEVPGASGDVVPAPAPAPTQEPTKPKGCGRAGRKGPYRSAM